MSTGSEDGGQLTVGATDTRITSAGYFLRKFKLDELPQLFNVFKGEMSFVGPRPEVRKYVDMYSAEQKQILNYKPGITDYSSIAFSNENELLATSSDPEKFYIENIIPRKISMSLQYMRGRSLFSDLKILAKTAEKIFKFH